MANKRIFEFTENSSPDGTECFLVDKSTESEAQYVDIDTIATYVAGTYADAAAIHDDEAGEIYYIDEKTTLDDADLLLIEDNEDSYNKKKLLISSFDLSQCDNTSSQFVSSTELDFNNFVEKTTLVDADVFAIQDSENSYVFRKFLAGGIPTRTHGSGAPTSTPSKICDFYVDTTAGTLYFSKGTSSSADWVAL